MKKQVVWAHGLGEHCITVWKPRQQEHALLTLHQRQGAEMHAAVQLASSSSFMFDLSPWAWCHPLRACLHPSDLPGNTFTDTYRAFFSDGSKYRQADDQLSQVDWVLLMGTGYSLQPSLSVRYKHRGWLAMVFGHLHGILSANWPSSLRQMKIIKPQEFVVLSLLPPMLRDAQGCWQGCVT